MAVWLWLKNTCVLEIFDTFREETCDSDASGISDNLGAAEVILLFEWFHYI